MVKRIVLWIAVILTSVMIFLFSASNGVESKNLSEKVTDKVVQITEEVNNNEDSKPILPYRHLHGLIRKIGHIFEFALLGVFSFLLARNYNLSFKKSMFISLGYCLLFAVSDEIHQLFVDGRAGRAIDVAIDFCGSSIGVWIFYLKEKIELKHTTK